MAEIIVVIPGIMGTSLFLPADGNGEPEKVWPPTWDESLNITGYKRIEKLVSPKLQVGDVIQHVCGVDFYRPLTQLLKRCGFRSEPTVPKFFVEFPYDWRRDLRATKEHLENFLDSKTDGYDRITILAHSMGGLIARLALEDPKNSKRPWLGKVVRTIFLGTPHNGAPLAIARAIGIDEDLGISGGDFRKLANHPDFPSGIQLFPSPGAGSCWNQHSPELAAIDVFDTKVASQLELNPDSLEACKDVHRMLQAGAAPQHVQYLSVASSSHRTGTRVNFYENASGEFYPRGASLTKSKGGGDGTAPIFSTLLSSGQQLIVVEKHATIFASRGFKAYFERVNDVLSGPMLHDFNDVSKEGEVFFDFSFESMTLPTNQALEVTIDFYGSLGSGEENAKIVYTITRCAEDTLALSDVKYRIDNALEGPIISPFKIQLPSIDEPGIYQLDVSIGKSPIKSKRIAISKPSLNGSAN